ncbi:MAG: MmgE/PrpD family protein [Amylibacter sp.]
MKFDQIAEFTLGAPDVPEHALQMAATLLIDTLGVAAGAAQMASGRIARDHAVRFQSAGTPADAATLLFDGRKSSISGAAFATATQIDNLDAHDGYNPTKGHIGCAVIPALCAFAEHNPNLTGRDALAALVMSYEISARAAIALHATVTDYHTSGAWNALGAAAIGARFLNLAPDVLRHALGIAEYHGPRSQMMREIANPTMLHDGSGMGAMVGTMAALMAQDGFEGAPAITIEDAEVAHHWSDLGIHWTILDNYIKPYPICRWAHAAIDALGQVLQDNDLHEDDVSKIEVRTFAQAAALYPGMPKTTSQAQYSLPFALATRLVHGRIGPEHVMEQGLTDTRVADALGKIEVYENSRHSERFPTGRWSDVTVRTHDGAAHASGDIHARGGPESPMSIAEIEAKFHVMAAPLAPERRAKIWRMQSRLLDPDVKFSELLSLIHASPEPQDA